MRYKFRTFRSNRWRGFSLCPHYTHIVPGLPSCPLQPDRGLWTVRSVVLSTLSRTIKSKAKMHSRCLGLAFFFVFPVLPGRRRTLNLQTHCLAGITRNCLSRYAFTPANSAVSRLQLRAILVWSLACLAKMSCHVFTAQLAFSLCGGFVSGVSQHGHRFAITLGCPVALARPQRLGRRASLGSSTVLRHCVQYVLQLLDGLQALASLPN